MIFHMKLRFQQTLCTYVLLVECWYVKECRCVLAVDDYVFFNEIMEWNVILFYLLIINTIFNLLAFIFSGMNTTRPRWHGYFWNHNFRFHSSMRETNQLPGYMSAVSQIHRHQLWPWRAVDCLPTEQFHRKYLWYERGCYSDMAKKSTS